MRDTKELTSSIDQGITTLIEDINYQTDISDLIELKRKKGINEAIIGAEQKLMYPNLTSKNRITILQFIGDTYLIESLSKHKAAEYYGQAAELSEGDQKKLFLCRKMIASNNSIDALPMVEAILKSTGINDSNKAIIYNVLINTENYEKLYDLIKISSDQNKDILKGAIAYQKGDYTVLKTIFYKHYTDHKIDINYELTGIYYCRTCLTMLYYDPSASFDYDLTYEKIELILNAILKDNQYYEEAAKLLCFVYYRIKKYNKCNSLLSSLIKSSDDEELGGLYIILCRINENHEEIVKYIHENKSINQLKDQELNIYFESYLSICKEIKQELIDSIKDEFDKRHKFIYYAESLIIYYHRKNDFDSVTRLLSELSEETSILKESLTGFYKKVQGFKGAVKHYDKIYKRFKSGEHIDSDILIATFYVYIELLVQRGKEEDYERILEVKEHLPYYFFDEDIFNCVIVALMNTNQKEQVTKIYNMPNYPRTEVLKDATATVYFETRWYSLALEIWKELYNENTKVDILIKIMKCEYYRGELEESLKYAKIVGELVLDPAAELLYFLHEIFKQGSEFEESMNYLYRGFVKSGRSEQYWGHYMGNFYLLTNNETMEIKKEWHQELMYIQSKYKDGEISPQGIKIIQTENKEDGSLDLSNLLEELDNRKQQLARLNEEWEKYGGTYTILATLRGASIYETWIKCCFDKEINIRAINKNRICNFSGSNAICVDITVLFNLQIFNVIEMINSIWEKIYISQVQFMDLKQYIRDLEQGRKFPPILSVDNYVIECLPADIDEVLKELRWLETWISNNTSIHGGAIDIKNQIHDFSHYDLCKDMFEYAVENKISLALDGVGIQNWFNALELECFNTYEIVTYFHEKKICDDKTFHSIMLNLYYMGYQTIPIGKDTFIYGISKWILELDEKGKALCRIFANEDYSFKSRVGLASAVICEIWEESYGNCYIVTEAIFSNLISKTSATFVLGMIRKYVHDNFNIILVVQKEKLLTYLDEYEDSLLII